MNRAKVAIIFTGGTISMTVDEKIGAAVPTLNAEQILSMASNIDTIADIEIIEYSEVPGPHITTEMLFEIRDIIFQLSKREEINGIIVTHGTDSLEESAYFLDLTLNISKPVVLVGAMRNSSELGYDGSANLSSAICTAISPHSINRGVLVVLNNEVNLAKEVTKTNTLSLNTFQSSHGAIGIIDTNEFVLHRRGNIQREYIDTRKVEPNVFLIKSYLDMDSSLLDFCINSNAKGIVIEAMGRGNLPPKIVLSVERAIKRNIAVVIVSRCPSGRVRASYGYYGGGKMLEDMGVIFADELSGPKARLKLMLLLSTTSDLEEIKLKFN
ncbi:MAG: asparaginase [Filifactoraceae bacterium]